MSSIPPPTTTMRWAAQEFSLLWDYMVRHEPSTTGSRRRAGIGLGHRGSDVADHQYHPVGVSNLFGFLNFCVILGYVLLAAVVVLTIIYVRKPSDLEASLN